MTDDEIRGLVRMAIQKHLGTSPAAVESGSANLASGSVDAASGFGQTISFARYVLPRAEDDTMCLIEPAVRCNHCGYCLCHGH